MTPSDPVVILPVRPIAEAPRDGEAPWDGEPVLLFGGTWEDDVSGKRRTPIVARWLDMGRRDRPDWVWVIAALEAGYSCAVCEKPTHWASLETPAGLEAPVAAPQMQVCSPPVDETLPELAMGQVWESVDDDCRRLLMIDGDMVRFEDIVRVCGKEIRPQARERCTDFLAWARRTNARPRS